MKCDERMPGDSWRTCELDLKHAGRHKYLTDKWSRPEPNEPNVDVESLLDETRPQRAWGLDERSFPIVVVETVTRVVWVDAENEDDALAYWADDYSDLELQGTTVLDADLEFQRPDEFQRDTALQERRHGAKVGPLLKCPGCNAESFEREWFHDPYRKCHGPIEWRAVRAGRTYREFRRTPAFDAARKQVAA